MSTGNEMEDEGPSLPVITPVESMHLEDCNTDHSSDDSDGKLCSHYNIAMTVIPANRPGI